MGNARRLTCVAGRWSAGHPWTAIAAWIGAVVVLMVAGHPAYRAAIRDVLNRIQATGWLPRSSRPAPPPVPLSGPPSMGSPPVTRVRA